MVKWLDLSVAIKSLSNRRKTKRHDEIVRKEQKMVTIKPTNVCCIDVQQDCLDYLKGLGLHVYEGSLGSVFNLDWKNMRSHTEVPVLADYSFPRNLQEYHVFIHDMNYANEKEYKIDEHDLYKNLERAHQSYLECRRPITLYDLRPFGAHVFKEKIQALGDKKKNIFITFAYSSHSVEYYSNEVGWHMPENEGSFTNNEAWLTAYGYDQYGTRVQLVNDKKLSYELFKEHLDNTEYYRVFQQPNIWKDNKQCPDENFMTLLNNENGECVSYVYFSSNSERIEFVLPQVSDKLRLLKALFENVLFRFFTEFFPDIESGQWIHDIVYELPNETSIREKIEAKKQAYEDELKKLNEEAENIKVSNKYLKDLLSASGDELVNAVKSFLEYLGFENVIDKDKTVEEGGIKEEDLTFDYKGTSVLMEVKGINGTSSDSECSQIDKVVLRRIRKHNRANFHGVYVVNNQRNIEPLQREVPPFNETKITDAENQMRTMAYTAQFFALYFDIENGYVRKEDVRECFFKPGLLSVHDNLISLGVPPKFFAKRTVLCFHLKDVLIRKGDLVFYFDELQRMVGAEVMDIQIDGKSIESATTGDVSIKVSKAFPRSGEVFVKK